jgi:CheY-like chemotaxis protein
MGKPSRQHHWTFPLKRNASILKERNDASRDHRWRNIDMANETSLIGHTVLVVEDDFHLATCTRHALSDAGAEVIGPVAQEDEALALIDSRAPYCAIIDINLGQGARFTVADALKARGVPFMFMTGYDDVMIPERFNDVGRMRKPSGFRLVVQAAAQMCRERRGCQFLQAGTFEFMSMSSVRKTTFNALAGPGMTDTGHIAATGVAGHGVRRARA